VRSAGHRSARHGLPRIVNPADSGGISFACHLIAQLTMMSE
jgi:hypothetical protein